MNNNIEKNFVKKTHAGGILLTTLLFVFLVAFIFTLTLENFYLARKFDERTKQFYLAKSMVQMVLEDITCNSKQQNTGTKKFSTALVEYQISEHTLFLSVHLEGSTYYFEEKITKEETHSEK